MEFIIALLIVLGVLDSIIGFKYAKKRFGWYFNPADIAYVQSLFGLTMDIIDELDMKQEKDIKFIGGIVSSAINYVLVTSNTTGEVNSLTHEIIDALVWDVIKNSCANLSVELNDNRIKIIQGLIDITLNKVLVRECGCNTDCVCDCVTKQECSGCSCDCKGCECKESENG